MPADFSSSSPNPANWSLPSALYPQSTCNTTTYFGPQSIQIEIDLCGLYAGVLGVFNRDGLCQGLCTDLIHNPRNYDTAYFEIEYLRVFTQLSLFLCLPYVSLDADCCGYWATGMDQGHCHRPCLVKLGIPLLHP